VTWLFILWILVKMWDHKVPSMYSTISLSITKTPIMLVADDMFVIIPLPDDMYVGVLPRPFGDADFESLDNGADGFGCAT
jgi:hypothetical protein